MSRSAQLALFPSLLGLVLALPCSTARAGGGQQDVGAILNGISNVIGALNTGPIPGAYPPLPPGVGPYVPYPGNSVVGGGFVTTPVWDPARGMYVNSTQGQIIYQSALSPYRNTVVPGTYQHYNYWNGTAWVQGTRWLGYDNQWHGDDNQTIVGPGGTSVINTTRSYMRRP